MKSTILNLLMQLNPEIRNRSIFRSIAVITISIAAFFYLEMPSAYSCNTPIPLNIQHITIHSGEISWFQTGSADSFDISFRKVPAPYPTYPQITGVTESSFNLMGLDPGGLYEFRIRAHCESEVSDWSQPRRFITHLTNPSPCSIHLPLGDNNCGGLGDLFTIWVDSVPGGFLGVDVFISEVKAIVSHTWPADLSITLRNPAGNEIILSADNGIGDDHYGDPESSDCSLATVFSDAACTGIESGNPPFIGLFKPQESFSILHDSSQAAGNWQLHICDKAPGDVGTLVYFEIVFEELSCKPPEFNEILFAEEEELSFSFTALPNCDSVLVEWGPKGFTSSFESGVLDSSATQMVVDCNAPYLLIEGLIPAVEYDIYMVSHCSGQKSSPSCPETVSTLCASPQLVSDFDSEELCPPVCNEYCNLRGWWTNSTGAELSWLVNEGPTPAGGTGPSAGFGDKGNYLYYHSSGPDCQYPGLAVLESTCLKIQSGSGNCDMSFYYHMWGPHVNRLDLILSTDGGFTWDTLWSLAGNQGNEWIEVQVDLSAYHGTTGKFRFVAQAAEGALGDIGLDHILLYNSVPADSNQLFYFVDMDGDGYGVDGTETFFCTHSPPEGWADRGGDCDDGNPNIHPGAEIIPCNLVDENCTGLEDDQPTDDPMRDSLILLIHESCALANDGFIEVEISGGVPPYTIEWNNGDTTSAIIDLGAGVYFATVTDSDGCLYRTDFFEIESQVSINFVFSDIVRPSCISSHDGSISILTGGGLPPFQYKWNTGDTSSQLIGVGPGTYHLTVTDANQCEFVSPNFTLTAQNPFVIQVAEKIQPSCYAYHNGSIQLAVTGGEPPYQYLWNTGDSLYSIHNLNSGWYSVTVTDSTGCAAKKDSIFLDQPEELLAFYPVVSPPICPGKSTGQILTEVQGGSFPYSFLWQNGTQNFSTKDLLAIPSGTYHLSLTDFNGCSFEDWVTVEGPDPYVVEIDTLIQVTCGNRSDGQISLSVSGGWQPYQLFWNNGVEQTTHLTNLSSGDYQFTLTDQADCKFTSAPLTIQNLELPLEISLQITDSISCSGKNDGVIQAMVNSVYSPFLFNWSHQNAEILESSTHSVSGLSPNNYSLTVSDASGCVGHSFAILLPEPDELLIGQVEIYHPSCHRSNDGQITPNVTGGTPPYRFQWSNETDEAVAKNLEEGIYSFTVTDRNGCEKQRGNFQLNAPSPLELNIETTEDEAGKENGTASIRVQGGTPPYNVIWDTRIQHYTDSSAHQLKAGVYDLTIEDENHCLLDTTFTIELINSVPHWTEGDYTLSPNPTSRELYLDFSREVNFGELRFYLIDQLGRRIVLTHYRETGSTLRLPLPESLPIGHYTLEVLHSQFKWKITHSVVIHQE
nr:proprotein convertase P-domain-containing protein [Saprospiraceae bacterium]